MMQKKLSPWTEEDVKRHKELDDLLSKNVNWKGSTGEMVQIYRSLVWFAQLRERINGSIAEITAVYNPTEEKEKIEKRAKAKAKKEDK